MVAHERECSDNSRPISGKNSRSFAFIRGLKLSDNMKRNFFHPIVSPPSRSGRAVSFRRSLGRRPPLHALRVERVERQEFADYIREKIIYTLEPDLATVAWVCRPQKAGRWPAVLCCHGAGPGKDPLVGFWNGRECLEYHKNSAVRLARRGYVTLAPERRGFGECAERPYNQQFEQYLRALDAFYLRTRGVSRVALDTWDMTRAVDVLTQRAEVDAERIGCLGVYDGATVAAGAAALDPRIKAVCVACPTDDLAPLRLVTPRPVQIQIAKAGPPAPRNLRWRHARRHVFDGVIEVDFPAMADWMDRFLR